VEFLKSIRLFTDSVLIIWTEINRGRSKAFKTLFFYSSTTLYINTFLMGFRGDRQAFRDNKVLLHDF
jgi:hypothetical protein